METFPIERVCEHLFFVASFRELSAGKSLEAGAAVGIVVTRCFKLSVLLTPAYPRSPLSPLPPLNAGLKYRRREPHLNYSDAKVLAARLGERSLTERQSMFDRDLLFMLQVSR